MGNAYSMPWDKGRPVLLQLPRDGYQNNPDVAALLTYPDEFLTATKTLLETLYQKLDPLVCPVEWLDYLGWLNGWSAEYWDTLWSPTVKRALIVVSNSVWAGLGQQQILELVLGTHNIEHRIWAAKSLQLPFTLPGRLDTPKGKLFIRLPLKYLRGSQLFKEAERTRLNFVPCTIVSKVTYEYFYLGYSAVGEPVFSV